jgi:hypothetical protein
LKITVKRLIKNSKGRVLELNDEKVSVFTLRIAALKKIPKGFSLINPGNGRP